MNPAVLKNLSYGMYVIGTKYNGRPNACVANSVIQISSSDPEKVLIALTKDTHSCTAIRENGIFTISVLSTDTPASVIGALGLVSGKNADKLKNIRHKVLIEGVPVVKENTCCWFLCKVISGMDVGQEMVFAAEIIAGSDSAIGTPMTYDFYRRTAGQLGVPGLQNAEKGIRAQKLNSFSILRMKGFFDRLRTARYRNQKTHAEKFSASRFGHSHMVPKR